MADLEGQIRKALHAKAGQVRPDPATWERVQTRVRRRQVFAWAVPATTLAAVAAVAVLVVPGWLPADDNGIELGPADDPEVTEAETFAGDESQSDPPEDPPAVRPVPDPEPVDPDPMVEPVERGPEVTAFFVRAAGEELWVEPKTVTLSTPTVGVARASMEALVAGDVDDVVTIAPEGTRVLGATIRDGVLRVDMSEHVASGDVNAEAEAIFAQQLAHTAQQFDDVEAVQLLIDGAVIAELWGHMDWSEPIEPDEFALSPVVISEASIEDGAVTVSGAATVHEATVELKLANPDGQYAEETFTTASCGGPCRGEWSHTFEAAVRTPGTWTVKAGEPQVSNEGRGAYQATVDIVVE